MHAWPVTKQRTMYMQALSISKELTDVRAERAVLRLLARGYRAVGPPVKACWRHCKDHSSQGGCSASKRSEHMPGCHVRALRQH